MVALSVRSTQVSTRVPYQKPSSQVASRLSAVSGVKVVFSTITWT